MKLLDQYEAACRVRRLCGRPPSRWRSWLPRKRQGSTHSWRKRWA